jgi:hypothetical protein
MVIVHRTFQDQIILFQWTTVNEICRLKLLRHFYRIFWFEEECRKIGGKNVLSTYGYFYIRQKRENLFPISTSLSLTDPFLSHCYSPSLTFFLSTLIPPITLTPSLTFPSFNLKLNASNSHQSIQVGQGKRTHGSFQSSLPLTRHSLPLLYLCEVLQV